MVEFIPVGFGRKAEIPETADDPEANEITKIREFYKQNNFSPDVFEIVIDNDGIFIFPDNEIGIKITDYLKEQGINSRLLFHPCG